MFFSKGTGKSRNKIPQNFLPTQIQTLTSDLDRSRVSRRQEDSHIRHQTLEMGYHWSGPRRARGCRTCGGGGGHRLRHHRVKWLVEGVVVRIRIVTTTVFCVRWAGHLWNLCFLRF